MVGRLVLAGAVLLSLWILLAHDGNGTGRRPDALRGLQLAERECLRCHDGSGAPGLAALARLDAAEFAGLALRPSQPMRGIRLAPHELPDLLAFLARLRNHAE